MLSEEGRRKLERWYFGAVSRAGDSYTHIVCVGTVLHHDSLLAHLLENPAYRAFRWQAVERFSPSPLWDTWRKLYTDLSDDRRERTALRFFRTHRKEMLAGTRVLWPRKHSYYELMCMLVSEGEGAFFRERQNQPVNPAAESGLDLSALTVSNFVVKNLIPVTIGNILGGVILSLLMWFCYLRKKK